MTIVYTVCLQVLVVYHHKLSMHVQVKNLEKMDFSDDEVMSLTLEIMQITYGKQLVMFMFLNCIMELWCGCSWGTLVFVNQLAFCNHKNS